jgi:signal transduction histidine kinase/ligand-binding sensor domain-containing protein
VPLTLTSRVTRWRLTLVFFALSFTLLSAAETDSWLVRVWTMGDELAGNNVVGVLESPDGFIWTVAGSELARFDGAAFKRFPSELFGPGTGFRIREFTSLRQGGLALALMNGMIARAQNGRIDILNRDLGDQRVRVEALFEDLDGSLLVIAGSDDSVYRLRDGRLTRLTAVDGLPPGLHCRFVVDQARRVWFVKGTVVGLLHGDRFETLREFPASLRVAIARAERGGIWIGAGTQLFHFDAGQSLETIGDVGLKNTEVRPTVLHEDRNGAVWFGTYTSGLFRFDGEHCESVPISHRQVLSMSEDHEGSLWIGTAAGGLNQVQPRALITEGEHVGVPSEAVQAICENSAHELWAVTQNGLVVTRDDATWKAPDGFNLGNATCIAADPVEGIWIGSKTGQLHRWRNGHLTTWDRAEGMAGAWLRILVAAKSGDIWMGSSRPGVVQRLHAGRIETIPLSPSPNLIRAIVEDATGNIWIAGVARMMWRITPEGRIIDESSRIPSPPKQVHTMQATADGTIWIGYDQAGIGRVHGSSFARITKENGLWDDRIDMLIPDGHGWLWLAANQSIFKVSEEELAAVAEGRAHQVKSIRYGQDQGVRAIFGDTVGVLRRSDGRLWIPMATAVAIIDPMQAREDAAPPPVVISELRVDDKPVLGHRGFLPLPPGVASEEAEPRLPPGHRRLDLDFTALSFRAPSNVRFRYRLEGFDDHWIETGLHRSASYARLPAGDYRFQVKACNSDGVWNEAGAAVAFTVAPFVWETWWFRGAALGVFTLAVYGTARYVSHRRLRRKLRVAEEETALERERSRIARDIHDDLGSRLTKIVLLSGLVARDRVAPEKSGERVWEISETARQLLSSLDETVWAVNPRNDTLPNLIAYVGEFAVEFLRTAEILCHVDLPRDPPPRRIAADVRHHLFLAVKETLNNVVRHAQATAAWLRITLTDDGLTLVIEDNGRGFTGKPDDPEADGLRNLQQRMHQIGGEFQIESRPGEGTRVTLTMRWPVRV